MKKKIAVLPGDGIGPEVTEAAVKVLQVVAKRFNHTFEIEYGAIGGNAIDTHQTPLPSKTIELCEKSDAVLLGAVGGPKWDKNPSELRPEKGLLAIRKHFDLFANLRPVKAVPSLLKASPLKEEIVKNVDLLVVRELTGGLYFGEPSNRTKESAVDTLAYTRDEIARIVDKGFELARLRRGKITSVDKENVLETSRLWREIVEEKKVNYPDVEVQHMLVDNAAMQIVTNPSAFDIILTENMFGDILSDETSVITGSLGLLPSASINSSDFGLYEPVHGSAPDIAGLGKANPAATILSTAMMLRYSFAMETEAVAIEKAVNTVFEEGLFTADLAAKGDRILTTSEWADEVVNQLNLQSVSNSTISTNN